MGISARTSRSSTWVMAMPRCSGSLPWLRLLKSSVCCIGEILCIWVMQPGYRVCCPVDPRARWGQSVRPLTLDKFGKRLLIIRMPAGQGRAVLHQIPRRPQYPLAIHLRGDFVVRAQDIEVAVGDALQHMVDGLLWRPGTRGLFRQMGLHHAGIDKARHQQVSGDLAAGLVAQAVLKPFGKC